MAPDDRWTDELLSLDRRKQILAEELDKVLHRPPLSGGQKKPSAQASADPRPANSKRKSERPQSG